MLLETEASLLVPIAGYLYRQSFRWQQSELQFYEYRIDLYGFSRVRDLTIAIELKLRNWQRAFQQALLYQLCADLVIIGMPTSALKPVDKALLREHGIGLIGIDANGRCRTILPASHTKQVRAEYREAFIDIVVG